MSILHPFSFWLNYQDCCFITTCSSFKCHSHWKHFKKVTLIGYTIFYDALFLLGYCRFSQWSVPRLLLFQSWGASDGPEEDPKQTKKPCTSMESDLGPAVQCKYPAYILCQAIWLTVDNQYSWTKLRLQPSKKRPLKVSSDSNKGSPFNVLKKLSKHLRVQFDCDYFPYLEPERCGIYMPTLPNN